MEVIMFLSRYITFVFLALVLFSCSQTSEPNTDARLVTVEEVQQMTGFLWFTTEYNAYNPKSEAINELKQVFNKEQHKIYFFVKPACTCELAQEPFPHLVKVLDQAGIPRECMVIYQMYSPNSIFPERTQIPVSKIPEIVFVSGTENNKSIMNKIDQFRTENPDSAIVVESFLLDAIKN